MANRWSQKEIDIIKTYYSSKDNRCHEMLPSRSKYAIVHKAHELGLKYHAWTADELMFLKQYYPTRGSVGCSKFINRPISAIKDKACRLGILTQCKNGKSIPHPIIANIGDNRVIATCPRHGNVEHHLKKYNRGPACKLCRMDYCRSKNAKRLSNLSQQRRLKNPKNLYAHRLRVQLRLAIRNKEIGCFRFLSYSPDDLRDHLEAVRNKQSNKCPSCKTSYDTVGFEIDHIIPLASANNDEEILALFALDNLSLLCKSCNCSKGKKIKVNGV